MKKQLAKLALAAALGLAFAFTLTSGGEESGGKLLEKIIDGNGNTIASFKYDEQNRIVTIQKCYIDYLQYTICTEVLNIWHNDEYGGAIVMPVGGIDRVFEKKGKTISNVVNYHTEDKFTINGNGHIIKKSDYTYEYKSGNLIGIKTDKEGGHTEISYEYDDKKSPFSGSKTPKWLLQELFPAYPYYASKNNVVGSKLERGGNSDYKYEYDADGYPIEKWYSDGDEKITIARYIYRGETQNIPAKAGPLYFGDRPLTPVKDVIWGIGKTNGDWGKTPATHLVVEGSDSKKFNRAAYKNKVIKIRYIGEKKREREPKGITSLMKP